MKYALLLLVLAAPDTPDTPKAAVDRIVAAVRKADLVGAYGQLGPGGRALLAKDLTKSVRTLNLDPKTATPEQVVAEFQKRLLAHPEGKQMAATFEIAILSLKMDGDKASAKVEMRSFGKTDRLTLLFARKDGRWRIDGIDAREARLKANQMAAHATLRNITSAQAQFQATARADANQNGVGEYGFFGELSGAVAVRGGKKLVPPVLSSVFKKHDKGVVTRSGYHFRIYLCDADGKAVGEEQGTDGVDAKLAEVTWCAYAWPVEYGVTGVRTFFVSQWGDVLQVDVKGYSGKNGPAAGAAFKKGAENRITAGTAINEIGDDGHRWTVAG
ncbi:MAG: DUF2950 family protein [Planctomycetota bacterium]|jgi:hypothetical protein